MAAIAYFDKPECLVALLNIRRAQVKVGPVGAP
jgi:hypothetical protein